MVFLQLPTQPVDYGATMESSSPLVQVVLAENDDTTFDDNGQFYQYLTSSSSFSYKKCLLAMIPIVIAAIIMGGLTFLLLRDFGHLYPGPNTGDPSYTPKQRVPSMVVGPRNKPTTTSSVDSEEPLQHASSSSSNKTPRTTNTKTTTNTMDARCSRHANCSGLNGNCCPTNAGVMLECCS